MARFRVALAVTTAALVVACGLSSRRDSPAGFGGMTSDGSVEAGGKSGGAGGSEISLAGGGMSTVPGYDSPCTPRFDGREVCLTFDQLRNAGSTDPRLVGGSVGDLGSEQSWRCPTLPEITFAACTLGEGCCTDIATCGPRMLLEEDSSEESAGSGPSGASTVEYCCYYVVTECGV